MDAGTAGCGSVRGGGDSVGWCWRRWSHAGRRCRRYRGDEQHDHDGNHDGESERGCTGEPRECGPSYHRGTDQDFLNNLLRCFFYQHDCKNVAKLTAGCVLVECFLSLWPRVTCQRTNGPPPNNLDTTTLGAVRAHQGGPINYSDADKGDLVPQLRQLAAFIQQPASKRVEGPTEQCLIATYAPWPLAS